VEVGDNGSLHLDLDNMPQPDAYMLIRPECGGLREIEDDYVTAAPELVGEIAASSVSYDLHAAQRVSPHRCARVCCLADPRSAA
jgi:hypothetical protein